MRIKAGVTDAGSPSHAQQLSYAAIQPPYAACTACLSSSAAQPLASFSCPMETSSARLWPCHSYTPTWSSGQAANSRRSVQGVTAQPLLLRTSYIELPTAAHASIDSIFRNLKDTVALSSSHTAAHSGAASKPGVHLAGSHCWCHRLSRALTCCQARIMHCQVFCL
jgi:hypothetical protein